MTLSKPPALATWMLEHLVLASDTDALAGDMMEEFNRCGSAGWYWRQVFAAIVVGLSRELCQQWKAAAFALVWTCVELVVMKQWFTSATYRSIHPWTLRHSAPDAYFLFMGAEVLLHLLIVWLGLVVYLALMGFLKAQRLTRGQLACLLFIVLEICLYQSGWRLVLRLMSPIHTPTPTLFIALLLVRRMPTFIALLLSLCATLPSGAIKGAARVRISE